MINQHLSLVIPRVFPQWVDEEKIVKIFREQQIGIISKVSIVRMPMEKGPVEKDRKYPIYKAYLYFSVWFEGIIAQNFQKRIYGKDKQARVVYDDPWFWTVFENTERVKLSKADKRLMRLSAEIYKNTLFVQAQQEELARELAEQKQKLAEQKQKLAEQNNAIQLLQTFCIENGLEIPFWSAKQPPSVEVSSLEALSAATAVASAEFVLQEDDDEEQEQEQEQQQIQAEYYSIPYECAESVLEENDEYFEEKFNYGFIPIKSYTHDWEVENPYTNNTPEQSRLCSYLGRDFEIDSHMGLPVFM
jgi:hypothetical protein